MPALALAQPRPAAPPPKPAPAPAQAAKPTKADVQKVLAAVGADKAKMQAYCDMGKLNDQMGKLDEKKDAKKLQALGQQADALMTKLGPDYGKLMDGLEQIDQNSAEGKEIGALLDDMDKKCK